jgi:hypothetical protein
MNERLKELAEQAGAWCYDNHDIPTMEQFQEKFAELIVRECKASIEKTIDLSCTTDDEKMGCEFAITNLLEHFGVE